MRNLVLSALFVAACGQTTVEEKVVAFSAHGTAEPECFTEPCEEGAPAPALPVEAGLLTLTAAADVTFTFRHPFTPRGLAFELVSPLPLKDDFLSDGQIKLATGEKAVVRVLVTDCDHAATFDVGTFAVTRVGNEEVFEVATQTIEFKPPQGQPPAPPPSPPATPRVLEVGASDVERVSGVDAGFFEGFPPGGAAPLLIVAARDAVEIINLTTDEQEEQLATPPGATYGAKPFTNASGKAIVATGEWGVAVWQYVAGSFAMLGGAPLGTGNITDVVVEADGTIIVANNSAGEIQFYTFFEGSYSLNTGLTIPLPGVVSVARIGPGEYMANTEDASGNGTSWWIPPDEPPREIGPVAKSPRIITASPDGNFAVMPCLGDGISFPQVYFFTRDGPGSEWTVPQTLLGIRAVSCDLAELENGNYLLAIPSSRTDEVRLLEMEPDAAVVDEVNQPTGEGCTAPNHATIFGTGVYLSCSDSKVDCRPLPE